MKFPIHQFRFQTYLFLAASAFLSFSCDKESPGEWQRLQEFPGKRQYFTAARYNDNCFVFFGEYRDDMNSRTNSTNVWLYEMKRNKWSPKQFYEGAGPRKNSSAFTIGDDIYVVGGVGPRGSRKELSELNEFLHYDPLTDAWTELNPFPGDPRSGALSFVIGAKAYFGLGSSKLLPLRDFWQYDPVTTEWRKLKDFPGSFPKFYYESYNGENVNSRLANFINGNEIIIISGVDSQHPEMWSFNTSTGGWTQITDIQFEDNDAEEYFDVYSGAISITYKDMGYIIIGREMNTSIGSAAVYRYNFTTSSWKNVGYFPGEARAGAFTFIIDDAIVFGTDYNYYNAERSGSFNAQPFEVWKYRPQPE